MRLRWLLASLFLSLSRTSKVPNLGSVGHADRSEAFYLWGDVPALMPITFKAQKVPGFRCGVKGSEGYERDHPNAFEWKKPGTSTPKRKFASAMIAKIPLPLSRHIAATFRP